MWRYTLRGFAVGRRRIFAAEQGHVNQRPRNGNGERRNLAAVALGLSGMQNAKAKPSRSPEKLCRE